MNAITIKTELEKLSGYSFQEFQTRCKGLAFDCALVMQEIKAKYGRIITGDFLQKELRLTHRFADNYRSVKRSKVSNFDAGFKKGYELRLQDHLNGVTKKPRQRGVKGRTGHKGVYHSTTKGKFKAVIFKDKQRVYLGTFATAELASIAYVEASKGIFRPNQVRGREVDQNVFEFDSKL